MSAIMFVCAANVCRSPLMEATFGAAGIRSSDPRWRVSSAGTRAIPDREACAVARSLAADDARVADVLLSHRARQVSSGGLERFDLIIAASRVERGVLARLAPHLRPRIFTAREALSLVRYVVDTHDGERMDVADVAAELHAVRGADSTAEPTSPRWSRVRAEWPDLPDVHAVGARDHRRWLAFTSQIAADLRQALDRLVVNDETV